jgi:carotenoid cleavage dioxygenase-like enzyme
MVLERSRTQEQQLGDGVYAADDWASGFSSQVREFDFELPAEDVEGALPVDLEGSFFRYDSAECACFDSRAALVFT